MRSLPFDQIITILNETLVNQGVTERMANAIRKDVIKGIVAKVKWEQELRLSHRLANLEEELERTMERDVQDCLYNHRLPEEV